MNITLYKFGKKRNSTKQPSGGGLTMTFAFIDDTSLLYPVVSISTDGDLWEYNYAYIDTLNRFYYVTDWTSRGSLWCASLSVDPLASWKDRIGNTLQYVERSSHTFDSDVVDNLYPTTSRVVKELSTPLSGSNIFAREFQDGTYVVGILNSALNSVGAVSYYAFTHTEFRQFCNGLMKSANMLFPSTIEITADLGKLLFNPFQYIASCVWLPFKVQGGTAIPNLPFGWWELSNVPCRAISSSMQYFEIGYRLPKHPQSWRGEYLNNAPYTTHRFMYPAIGSFTLDSSLLKAEEFFTCFISVDITCGKALIALQGGSGYESMKTLLTTSSAQLGVPVQMGQTVSNLGGMLSSALNMVGGVVSLDLDSIGTSIGNAVKCIAPTLQTSGSNGSLSGMHFMPWLETDFIMLGNEKNEQFGRPLMKNVKISSIPGYIKTVDAEIDFELVESEKTEIKTAMDGGFYYE